MGMGFLIVLPLCMAQRVCMMPMLRPLEICDLLSTRFISLFFLPLDAFLGMTNDGFMSGIVAISALS